MDADSFVFSFSPIRGLLEELKSFSEDLDLSEVYPSLELYSEHNMNVVEKMRLQSSPEIDSDDAAKMKSKT